MRSLRLALLLSASAALLVFAACGDQDYAIGSHPEILISIEEDEVEFRDAGEVSFGHALQIPISKTVMLRNTGNEDLLIHDVGWEVNENDAQIYNPFVKLLFTESPACQEGAVIVAKASCRFRVLYTPPVGKALDDFTPSTVVIKSNAFADDGSAETPEVYITFSMPDKIPGPQVNPPNYTFKNAKISKPESHTFTIGSDPDTATTGYWVESIVMETVSAEFQLVNLPNLPAEVLEPNAPDYQTSQFTVTYQPVDQGNDSNAVLVYTDVDAQPMRIALSTGFVSGSYELTYDHVNDWDFTNVNTVQTRALQVQSMGPGPITIDEPHWEPEAMSESFIWTAFSVSPDPEEADKPIDTWPRALTIQKSIRFDLTYSPPAGGEPHNGFLSIPYSAPENGIIEAPVLAGSPKPDIQMSPPNGSVLVSTVVAEAGTGERTVVIYNKGNGDLDIEKVEVQGSSQFLEAKVFSLVDGPVTPLIIPAHGMAIYTVGWDASAIEDLSGETEYFVAQYMDPYLEVLTDKVMGLSAFDLSDDPELPVANPGTYPDLIVGQNMSLNGVLSSPGPAGFNFGNKSYWWYLTSKPAGSSAYLNDETSVTHKFMADVAGEYKVQLQVQSTDQPAFLVSEPVEFTLTAIDP
jgi:hypothetical protein